MRRTLALGVGALGVALLLSGCVKVDMAMTLTPDDTMDGTIVFAVDKQLLTLGGGSPEDAFKDAASDAPFPTSPTSGSVRTEVYDEDGKYGQRYIFSGVPISSFDDPDLSITRQGDYYVVSGSIDLSSTGDPGTTSGSSSPLPLPTALTAGFDVAISITFPGEVVEHTGTLEGTTVTWRPTATGATPITAKGRATATSAGLFGLASSSSSTALGVGLGLAALVLVGAVVAAAGAPRRYAGARRGHRRRPRDRHLAMPGTTRARCPASLRSSPPLRRPQAAPPADSAWAPPVVAAAAGAAPTPTPTPVAAAGDDAGRAASDAHGATSPRSGRPPPA